MPARQRTLVSFALWGSLFGFIASGCSGTANKSPGAAKPGSAERNADGGAQPGARGEVGFAEGGERACMLHEQAGAYFRCLSGSDGQCFHYGSACTPKSSCMYDTSSGQHKLCEESQAGSCLRYGQPCAPEASCMFSQSDNRYRQCDTINDGKCQSFGSACQPGA